MSFSTSATTPTRNSSFYAVLCLVVMLVLLVKHRLTRMPIGRAREALREGMRSPVGRWNSTTCW